METEARSRDHDPEVPVLALEPVPANPGVENGALIPSTSKITIWRAMNTTVILGFGSAKAVLAFRDNPSADAVDVALGLIWALIAYWCGILEAEYPSVAPWLFEVDVKEPLVELARLVLDENVFLVLCLVAAGVVVYARVVEHFILILVYSLVFVGVLGVALPALIWFTFVFAYEHGGRLWARFLLSNPHVRDGWWNILHHVRAMDERRRRRYIWLPYIICMASVTVFVHPFPLAPYMPTVLAVLCINVLAFVGCYTATRVSLAFWVWFMRWRRSARSFGSWVENWRAALGRWWRQLSQGIDQNSGSAAQGAVDGLELANRGAV